MGKKVFIQDLWIDRCTVWTSPCCARRLAILPNCSKCNPSSSFPWQNRTPLSALSSTNWLNWVPLGLFSRRLTVNSGGVTNNSPIDVGSQTWWTKDMFLGDLARPHTHPFKSKARPHMTLHRSSPLGMVPNATVFRGGLPQFASICLIINHKEPLVTPNSPLFPLKHLWCLGGQITSKRHRLGRTHSKSRRCHPRCSRHRTRLLLKTNTWCRVSKLRNKRNKQVNYDW